MSTVDHGVGLKIRKATRREAKLRMLGFGAAGSGKSLTAILLGLHLAELEGTTLCVIDSESNSSDRYADAVPGLEFENIELEGLVYGYHPLRYVKALELAVQAGHGVIVIDSGSHAWDGKNGVLDLKERESERLKAAGNRNEQAPWIEPSRAWSSFIEAIKGTPAHVIVCARAKTDWGDVRNERTGRMERQSVGVAPVLRKDFEYEFDLFFTMDKDDSDKENPVHYLTFEKNRTRGAVGNVWVNPGEDLAHALFDWLKAGGADIQMRRRELQGVRPAGVSKEQFADALIAAGITGVDDLMDDKKFRAARALVLALAPAAATDGGVKADGGSGAGSPSVEGAVAPAVAPEPAPVGGGPGAGPGAATEVVEAAEALDAASPGAVDASGSEPVAIDSAAGSPTPGGEEGTTGTVSSPAPSPRRRRAAAKDAS